MVRDYTDEPLSPSCVERVLASALRAPSAGFSQGWAFLALSEPEDRARFWQFAGTQTEHSPGMRNAPLIVVSLSHKDAYLDRYAEADKGWEDRGRVAMARALLGHRHGDGDAPHAAHRGRRGTGCLLLRPHARRACPVPRGIRDPCWVPADRCDDGRSSLGERAAAERTRRSAPAIDRRRRPSWLVGSLRRLEPRHARCLRVRSPSSPADVDALDGPRGPTAR